MANTNQAFKPEFNPATLAAIRAALRCGLEAATNERDLAALTCGELSLETQFYRERRHQIREAIGIIDRAQPARVRRG
jgi:hypothetical protein